MALHAYSVGLLEQLQCIWDGHTRLQRGRDPNPNPDERRARMRALVEEYSS
jgi:hypothetical protein